jgi:hypothetical protein
VGADAMQDLPQDFLILFDILAHGDEDSSSIIVRQDREQMIQELDCGHGSSKVIVQINRERFRH